MATVQSSPPSRLGRNPDERLARRATKGDRQALGAIFERYQLELYRFCLGLLGEPQDAEDALQNTMVKALRSLPGEKREIALRPWLYRIAHNEAVDLRRGKRTTQALDGHLLDGQSSVAETAENRERLQWALRDLRDLPDRQRAVLVMRELSGLDFADIGAALGTSGAVVRQTLYEARRNLEQMDLGRSMRCEAITRVLSDADGRISSRREIRAHLRDCPDCRRFQERIDARKEALAGIAPLPAGAAAGILQSVLGGAGGSAAGGFTAALGGGAAKSIGAAGILKVAATVAAVAVVSTVAVERNLHGHRGDRDVASTASSPRAHEVGATPTGDKRHLGKGLRPSIHDEAATPEPNVAGAPHGSIVRYRLSERSRRNRASDGRIDPAQEDSSIPALVDTDSSSSSAAAASGPSEESPKAEMQPKAAKEAEKQEEKTEKAEAKVKPEHPAHPGHPPYPTHSQKPVESPAAPEGAPEEVVSTSAPEAEGAPESTFHSPNGKAKGHEKQAAG